MGAQTPSRRVLTPDEASRRLGEQMLTHFRVRDMRAPSQRDNSPRIIAFVGAGASRQAGLPSGQELKQDLFQELTQGSEAILTREGIRRECIKYWEKRVRSPKQISDDPVENLEFGLLHFCQALSPYAAVRNRLRELIGNILAVPETYPILTYELLAHLLNHHFIDHIISLNFDLLLDESLRDELGNDGVDIIVSDRDIPPSTPLVDVDEKPKYLKPHGSILVPDSMRFTLTETSGISTAMEQLIVRVVFGDDISSQRDGGRSVEDLGKYRKQQPVILLFLGWACAERDFQRIFRSRLSQVKEIYWFIAVQVN
jgi:hypothetical protein